MRKKIIYFVPAFILAAFIYVLDNGLDTKPALILLLILFILLFLCWPAIYAMYYRIFKLEGSYLLDRDDTDLKQVYSEGMIRFIKVYYIVLGTILLLFTIFLSTYVYVF